jgi:6-pyruvoyltetrahydropterin/6-carboxytetrahydropterin synthase
MVMDFADLKAMAAGILDPFDHQVINDIPPFDELNTTAELFSEYVFREVEQRLATDGRVSVERVEVWENDTSCAAFEA